MSKGKSNEEFRLLLLGKNGSGKSTTGNTIFGEELFQTNANFASVTGDCELKRSYRDGRKMEIMDSPGLLDTTMKHEQVCTIIVQSVAGMHPGPNAILYVVRVGRYTAEEFSAYNHLKALFDAHITKHMIVLFTGGDNLERQGQSMEGMMQSLPDNLRTVLTECSHRYILFNNVARDPKPQVEHLLDMVRQLDRQNGGPYVCPKYMRIGESLEAEVARRMEEVDKKELERQKYVQQLQQQIEDTRQALSKYLIGKRSEEFRLLLLGKTGSGKSTTGNTIFGEELFQASANFASVTADCELKRSYRDGRRMEIMDSPGLFDMPKKHEQVGTSIIQSVAGMHPGPNAILYVVRVGRYTAEEFSAYNRLKALFDARITKHMIVLFTGGDDLERKGQSMEGMMQSLPDNLRTVLTECSHRYILFNNFARDPRPQVKRLLDMVRQLDRQNGGPYVCPKYMRIGESLEAEVARRMEEVDKKELERQKYVQQLQQQIEDTRQALSKKTEEFRLLLLGKTGSGKSTTGNTIFGEELFQASANFASVTADCELKRSYRDGRQMEIMDSPGLFDTTMKHEQVGTIIVQSVAGMHPGPNAILYVVRVGRYTAEEFSAYNRLKALFDARITKHMIVLFTGGDNLERQGQSMEGMMQSLPDNLRTVLTECSHRYILFNNFATDPRPQVERLLDMVRQLHLQNGGPYACPKYEKIGESLEAEVARRMEQVDKKELERQKYVQQLQKQTENTPQALSKTKEEMKSKEQEQKRQMEQLAQQQQQQMKLLQQQMEEMQRKERELKRQMEQLAQQQQKEMKLLKQQMEEEKLSDKKRLQ